MKNSNEDIYSRIRKEREKRGWSQVELGQRMNEYSKKTFPDDLKNHYGRNDIENLENHRKIAKERDILTLSAVFGLDCHYLLTGIHQNNITASNMLGLSNETIDILKSDLVQNGGEKCLSWSDVINFLVENDCYELCYRIYDFLTPFEDGLNHQQIQDTLTDLIKDSLSEGKISKEAAAVLLDSVWVKSTMDVDRSSKIHMVDMELYNLLMKLTTIDRIEIDRKNNTVDIFEGKKE